MSFVYVYFCPFPVLRCIEFECDQDNSERQANSMVGITTEYML